MQEEKGALSWTGFLGKLVAVLGGVILILIVLSWLRCGDNPSGKAGGNSDSGRGASSVSSFVIGLGKS